MGAAVRAGKTFWQSLFCSHLPLFIFEFVMLILPVFDHFQTGMFYAGLTVKAAFIVAVFLSSINIGQ